ncbi:quinolinate synthetase [Clostridium cavendishii DSM 21758]|uniref:Quinolinate synthase n=1 Tax=Clostridium cavendishii DSM 21758 TaxID=1121302 RepID=A0A1M6ARA4_9CLOT|nr:quinolinate synthase NadA [Clostridium cavendishii]SHI38951.1 quinolinate synthetase [Clostridium cavendishii DSM 21758]
MNLKDEILKLKLEKDALILAHYYQRAEIQDIADYVGDSYYLSKVAKDSLNKTIVFCGVKFMAESAKILSPNKTILLPVLDAGCPMADMANSNTLLELKAKYPSALVVSYINSTTEVKALSDVCVTSSSALKIINNIKNKDIIFLPDKNLGEYISEHFPNKNFVLWPGSCITHKKVQKKHIQALKDLRPNALVLVHPECEKEIRNLADFLGSTGELIDFSSNNPANEFIVVTESGVIHEMKKRSPEKEFYVPKTTMTCLNMKKTTLESVLDCLKNNQFEIKINEDIRVKALKSLENMHKLS